MNAYLDMMLEGGIAGGGGSISASPAETEIGQEMGDLDNTEIEPLVESVPDPVDSIPDIGSDPDNLVQVTSTLVVEPAAYTPEAAQIGPKTPEEQKLEDLDYFRKVFKETVKPDGAIATDEEVKAIITMYEGLTAEELSEAVEKHKLAKELFQDSKVNEPQHAADKEAVLREIAEMKPAELKQKVEEKQAHQQFQTEWMSGLSGKVDADGKFVFEGGKLAQVVNTELFAGIESSAIEQFCADNKIDKTKINDTAGFKSYDQIGDALLEGFVSDWKAQQGIDESSEVEDGGDAFAKVVAEYEQKVGELVSKLKADIIVKTTEAVNKKLTEILDTTELDPDSPDFDKQVDEFLSKLIGGKDGTPTAGAGGDDEKLVADVSSFKKKLKESAKIGKESAKSWSITYAKQGTRDSDVGTLLGNLFSDQSARGRSSELGATSGESGKTISESQAKEKLLREPTVIANSLKALFTYRTPEFDALKLESTILYPMNPKQGEQQNKVDAIDLLDQAKNDKNLAPDILMAAFASMLAKLDSKTLPQFAKVIGAACFDGQIANADKFFTNMRELAISGNQQNQEDYKKFFKSK